MAKIRLTKEFTFEMAHALENYDGACSHIHGHSYHFFVTVAGEPNQDETSPKYGMVMDFGDLKRIVNEVIINRYDHAFIVRATSSNIELCKAMKEHYQKVEYVDYQPTCENMISYFADAISARLPQSVELVELKLYETASSCAQWCASDNK